jgi:hypothetical protein
MRLFQENFISKKLRLVGVSVSNLIEQHELEMTSELFDDFQKENINPEFLYENEIIDEINTKFAKNIINIAKDKLRK